MISADGANVYIHGGRVAIAGSAAKSLVGKKFKILFNERKQVATATVLASGKYSTLHATKHGFTTFSLPLPVAL